MAEQKLCVCGCEQPLPPRRQKYATDECQKRAARAVRLDTVFNITAEEYDAILVEQGGHCATCPRKPREGKRLAVDHDHRTGYVRGLLCFMCNKRLLGARTDEVIKAIYEYITNPPARRVIGDRVAPGRPPKKRKPRRRTTR